MKRKPLLMICALALGLLVPVQGQAASSLDKINQTIDQIKQQQANASSQIAQLNNQIAGIQTQKGEVKKDLATIEQKLSDTQERIQKLDLQIDSTTLKAQDAAVQLDKATKRVEDRNDLLRTRVKVMYEMGNTSYLDVLLGAKDFGDFLNRLTIVNMIVNQDTKILEDNINDKKTIEDKKAEIDGYLTKLQGYYATAAQLKADLKQQQKERTAVMASLTAKEGQLEDIKAEQQQEMLDLVDKMKAALYQKNKILSTKQFTGGRFTWPLPDSHRITSPFGYRKDPFTGQTAGHDGLDIGAPQGTDIVAAADGVVIVSGYVRGFGNCVIIDHGSSLSTLYGHIRDGGLFVKQGQQVKKGQKIAEVGSTGRSTGPHLHFSVLKGRTPVNPAGYLN